MDYYRALTRATIRSNIGRDPIRTRAPRPLPQATCNRDPFSLPGPSFKALKILQWHLLALGEPFPLDRTSDLARLAHMRKATLLSAFDHLEKTGWILREEGVVVLLQSFSADSVLSPALPWEK